MLKLSSSGSFDFLESFLHKFQNRSNLSILEKYGAMGVDALSNATPVESGETAHLWRYKVEGNNKRATLTWFNDHVNNGVNIAVILQYGHATRNGGWVEGREYINPALRPLFDQMANDLWAEVNK